MMISLVYAHRLHAANDFHDRVALVVNGDHDRNGQSGALRGRRRCAALNRLHCGGRRHLALFFQPNGGSEGLFGDRQVRAQPLDVGVFKPRRWPRQGEFVGSIRRGIVSAGFHCRSRHAWI